MQPPNCAFLGGTAYVDLANHAGAPSSRKAIVLLSERVEKHAPFVVEWLIGD